MRDGSVIFWKGGLLVKPIYNATGSPLTHVAIILHQNGESWVYEAAPPKVHKVKLTDYETFLAKLASIKFIQRRNFSWFIRQPKVAYTPAEIDAMQTYADSQLGRAYRLRGWWSNDTRGIFCSQYIGNMIAKTGRIISLDNRESPGSLYDKLLPLYEG